MIEREALAELDALLDLDTRERESALARIAQRSPQAAATVAAWLAADARDEPRLDPGHYTPLVPPLDTEPDVAAANAGDRIGPYRLVREIGRGGMGSVWLAERAEGDFAQTVALKLIRPDLALPEADARFRRERRILAALKHPHIAQLLDGGVTDEGRPWLAMELVSGQSLRDTVRRGPLPPARLVPLAAQLASGLAHAHEAGVVHRDLKPDNVVITRDGFAKILDFGVAKLLGDDGAAAGIEATQPGRVIGSTPYMSPEQAGGEHVDFRSDQFALGALLYEAATGASAFARATPSQTVAAVLRDAPPALETLSTTLPAGLLRVIRRCLEKDPALRYGATSDLARDLADLERGTLPEPSRATAPRARRAALLAALALAGLAAGWFLAQRAPVAAPVQQRTLRSEIALAPAERLNLGSFAMHGFALSPNGRLIAFGGSQGAKRLLYVRALDSRETVPLAGSEGGANPVFSPDSQWIAFFANQKLKKISVGGGTATALAEAPNALGGIGWPEPNRIVYSPNPSIGVWEVGAAGGDARKVTDPDVAAGEASHVWPNEVPGLPVLLYAAEIEAADTFDAARIYALDRRTGKRTLLVAGGSDPRVVDDVLYYARAGTIYAAPFDRERIALAGPPKPLYDGVMYSPAIGAAQFAIAGDVTLRARGGIGADLQELVFVDRAGNVEPVGIAPQGYDRVRVSPDGRRAVLQVSNADDDLYTLDFARRTLTRVTDSGENIHPSWSPDGRYVIYSHHGTPAPPPPTLYRRLADGSGAPERLLPAAEGIGARLYSDAAPDGNSVVYAQYTVEHNFDLYLLDLRTREPRLLLSTPQSDIAPRFSPDGRWIAHASYPTLEGVGEVYIQSVTGESRRWQVSNAGGGNPVWSRDGRELFYISSGVLYSVPLAAGDDLAPGAPVEVLRGEYATRFDVFPDGRFIMMRRIVDPGRAGPLLLDVGRIGEPAETAATR